MKGDVEMKIVRTWEKREVNRFERRLFEWIIDRYGVKEEYEWSARVLWFVSNVVYSVLNFVS